MGSAQQSVYHKAHGGEEPYMQSLLKASLWSSSSQPSHCQTSPCSSWIPCGVRLAKSAPRKSNLHPYIPHSHLWVSTGTEPKTLLWLGKWAHRNNQLHTLESKLFCQFLPVLLLFAESLTLKQEFPKRKPLEQPRQVQALQKPLLSMVVKCTVHLTCSFLFSFIVGEVLLICISHISHISSAQVDTKTHNGAFLIPPLTCSTLTTVDCYWKSSWQTMQDQRKEQNSVWLITKKWMVKLNNSLRNYVSIHSKQPL